MSEVYKIGKGPYELDLDKNGQLAFTQKNIMLINFAIRLDSNYRSKEFPNDCPNNELDSVHLIQKFKASKDMELIDLIVEKLNKENSTHLQVRSSAKRITKKIKLYEANDLISKLKIADNGLVLEIASACDDRNNFSFATKFCTFMCRSLFEGSVAADNYSIYDNVLANVLPYYAWVYLRNSGYIARTNSRIESEFKNKKNYPGYKQLIDDIRKTAKRISGFEITRRDFDQLLWYYYKGSNERYKTALSFVKNEKAVLV